MNAFDQIVFVVDPDPMIRETLCDLLHDVTLQAVGFGSAAEYIAFRKPCLPACLILDLELPDIHGLVLQSQLADQEHPPIVFIAGHGDVYSSVRAMKAGAVDFLIKPLCGGDLLRAVRAAIEMDRKALRRRAHLVELQQRFAQLTPREREVLPLVAGGLLNKQAAAELQISEVTLQIHRSRIMHKMRADSLAALVHMAVALGCTSGEGWHETALWAPLARRDSAKSTARSRSRSSR
jgi:FixJ family two-component response regulator